MSFWDRAFRVAVVTLLAVIAMELGGWAMLTEAWRHMRRSVVEIGGVKEEPAPNIPGQPSSLDRLYGQSIEANIQQQLQRERESRQRLEEPR
jgi:hypothetical protein